MSSTRETLADAERVVAGALAAWTPALSDAEACAHVEEVERLGRLVDTLRVLAAGDIDARSGRELGDDSLARQHGANSAALLVEQLSGTSSDEASRRVRLGRRIIPAASLTGDALPPRFEIVAAAMRAGEIGVDSALTITRHLTDAGRRASFEQQRIAESQLVEVARATSADLVAVHARAWRHALDPDGAEPRDRAHRRARRFVIGREADGMTPFWGDADPVSAAQLRAWLSERTAPDRVPRFFDANDPAGLDPEEVADPSFRDPRTREQRSFDVLMGLLLAGVRADANITTPVHAAANVLVVVKEEDFETGNGLARVNDVNEPISSATAATIACDAGIQRVVLDEYGQPVRFDVRRRYFSARQRRLLAARDGGCVWPRCTAPPSWCHAHHIVEWSKHGPTEIDNGALLCSFHHHLLHEGDFQMRMINGRPHLLAPPRLDMSQTWKPVGRERIPEITAVMVA